MVWLPQKQLHGKYGYPFITSKPSYTTFTHKWWQRLVCLAMKAQESSLDLNWSFHFLSPNLTSPRPNTSAHQGVTQSTSHPLHMVQPGHQNSEAEDLLTPMLNSAGCLQTAFSKTGRMMVPTIFWMRRKEKKWICAAILVHCFGMVQSCHGGVI